MVRGSTAIISKILSLYYIITNIGLHYDSAITSLIHQPTMVEALAQTMAAATPSSCIAFKCIKQWVNKMVLL